MDISHFVQEFPEEVREDVEGLLLLGAISETVEFCGHEFTLRTIRIREELAAANAAKPYRESIKEAQAVMTAEIGMALEVVDGDESFCPQAGPSLDRFAEARFNYVSSNWYWPTIEFLYSEFAKLKNRQVAAIRAMQDFQTRSLRPSSPSVSSLIGQGISSEQTDSETLS
jgi:hypothetical protein